MTFEKKILYKLFIIPKAEKQILDLPKSIISVVTSKIQSLAQNPRPQGVKKLTSSKDAWRIRSGDYQVLYTIDDRMREVVVYKVSHQKNAYR